MVIDISENPNLIDEETTICSAHSLWHSGCDYMPSLFFEPLFSYATPTTSSPMRYLSRSPFRA